MDNKAEMLGLEVVRQDDGFEDTRGNEYGKAMSQRQAKQPKTKKYPLLFEGTNRSINLTQGQMDRLLRHGILPDRSGNQLVLEDGKLRLEKRKNIALDVLKTLADAGEDTTGMTGRY